MEGRESLIIAVGSSQFPPSIEAIDDYKYPQEELICNKQKTPNIE